MTREEFIAAFMRAPTETGENYDEIVTGLRERLRELSAKQQFQILFPIAVKNPYVGDFPVLTAAELLEELSPECPISCEEAIRALLPEWSVSLEQVPFYLAARFGPKCVFQTVSNLETELKDESQRATLRTVSYWVHVREGTWP